MEGAEPSLFVGQDGDAGTLAFRNHEAVVAIERCDVGRVDAQPAFEAPQEGDRFAAIGNGVQIPVEIVQAFQLSPAGCGEGGIVGHGGRSQFDKTTSQKTCQEFQAVSPIFP
ncbi:hypothetical protein D3C76_1112790 [compost metagenome]